MRVILCRHGETAHNRNKLVQGQSDVSLNQTGIKQAETLADRFENEEIDKFYSSSLKRASTTAEIIAERHEGSKVEELDILREVDRAEFENDDFEKIVNEIKNSDIAEHKWKPEEGESMVDLQERGMKFLQKVKENHSRGETIFAMAHGGINGAIALGLLGHTAKNCFKIHQGNCCVNEIIRTDLHGWELKTLNDTDHRQK